MRYRQSILTAFAMSCGCAALLPPQRDPTREAEQKEQAACPLGAASTYPEELFDGRSVVGVKPLYSMVGGARTGPAYRLSGAAIQLRPISAFSSRQLESVLNCHGARSELARAGEPIIPDDPYWIAGQVVDVSVRSESGILLAEVRSSNVDTAKEVLRRAMAFAGGQSR